MHQSDIVTLAGLPYPIQDAVKIMKDHIYESLGDAQMKLEVDIHKFPLSIVSCMFE